MLTINPAKRITAHEALKHPWVCVSCTSPGPPPSMLTLGPLLESSGLVLWSPEGHVAWDVLVI